MKTGNKNHLTYIITQNKHSQILHFLEPETHTSINKLDIKMHKFITSLPLLSFFSISYSNSFIINHSKGGALRNNEIGTGYSIKILKLNKLNQPFY